MKNFEKHFMVYQYIPKIFHGLHNSTKTLPPPPTLSYILNVRSLRPTSKEIGYTNRQFQLASYFKKTLEFTRTV